MVTKICGGYVITEEEILSANLYVENGVIKAITEEDLPFDEVIIAKGCYVSPGFVDIHTHGAGGYDFLDNTKEAYYEIAKAHATHGTTSLVATVTSSTRESMEEAIRIYESLERTDGAGILGLHFEGPYFAPSQKGAQEERFLRNFVPEEYEKLAKGTNCILRWTGAPELDGAEDFAGYMKRRGILPCIGHSDATSEETHRAFEKGFTHITHLYSCTSSVHRKNAFRYAGIVEEAYLNDAMTVEIIADGVHLPADLLRLVYKIKGPEKIALITDSMRGAGMPDGESILGNKEDGLPVIIEDGVAKLPDRSAFAGSVAFADRLVRNMVNMAKVPITDAIKMASTTPARIIGAKTKGCLLPGYDADVVIFDQDINVNMTMVCGQVVWKQKVEA